MRPFLDSGFLLTLILPTSGSPLAWETAERLEGPLLLSSFQGFTVENRLQREMHSPDSTRAEKARAAAALQRFRWYLDQLVIRRVSVDYEIAIHLAGEWQKQTREFMSSLLFLWPALAVTSEATQFLSFDPRTRRLARAAGLQLLLEAL